MIFISSLIQLEQKHIFELRCRSASSSPKEASQALSLGAAEHSGLGDHVPQLRVAAMLVPELDDAGAGDAADLARAQVLLILAADVLHLGRVKGDLLVREEVRHGDLEDGLLHRELPGQDHGAGDERAEGLVAGFACARARALGGGDGVEEPVDPRDEIAHDGVRLHLQTGG